MHLVILTGAGGGIGRSIAHYWQEKLQENARYLWITKNTHKVQNILYPHLTDVVAMDASLPEAAEKVFKEKLGLINIHQFDVITFIHNAGILEPIAPICELHSVDIVKSVNVNLTTPILLSKVFLDWSNSWAQSKKNKRIVVQISSGAAANPISDWSLYCATKSAMQMFCQAMSKEQYAQLDIFSVAPGVVDTPMQALIRETPLEKFRGKDHFIKMFNDGQLKSPELVAPQLWNLVYSGSKDVVCRLPEN